MITIKYNNESTEQEMLCTVDIKPDNSVSVSFDFTPEVDNDSKDPYGIMGCIMKAITDHFGD